MRQRVLLERATELNCPTLLSDQTPISNSYSLRVTTSIYPVPSICAQDQISDWFASLAECLHWNVRKKQKHFDELSDLTRCSSNDTLDSQFSDKAVE